MRGVGKREVRDKACRGGSERRQGMQWAGQRGDRACKVWNRACWGRDRVKSARAWGSSINDVMPEGERGGSGPHDQQC